MPAPRQFKPLPHDSPLSGRYRSRDPSAIEDKAPLPEPTDREPSTAGPPGPEGAVAAPLTSPAVDAVPDPEGENFDYREVLDIYRRHAAAGISFLEMSLDAQMERHGIPSPAGDPPDGMDGGREPLGSEPAPDTGGMDADSLPEEPVDEGMLGQPVDEETTFYPNLEEFVEKFLANVFPFHQNATKPIEWVRDWYRYPALVFPLDSIWRGYETARARPGAMEGWYFQTFQLLSLILNKDSGIVASLNAEQSTTVQGEPLPCDHPASGWRQETLHVLSAGPKEGLQEPDVPEEGGPDGF
ncbi:DUF4913 domain-containing protein [Bifidobacterium sp. H6bp9]|uniref:DUF4913 domain-containing protein n=1 Tax=Bifidobacterium sp. H6bp9 TaxID=3051961 RepID=UPI0028BD31FF|nr:DUF4913 domain-containing protein [Bifidobacterium sp. H6bp9]MDT7511152.1 DUF4913 domain-containing protein [Bifidobacterium sp. H6bp9]